MVWGRIIILCFYTKITQASCSKCIIAEMTLRFIFGRFCHDCIIGVVSELHGVMGCGECVFNLLCVIPCVYIKHGLCVCMRPSRCTCMSYACVCAACFTMI